MRIRYTGNEKSSSPVCKYIHITVQRKVKCRTAGSAPDGESPENCGYRHRQHPEESRYPAVPKEPEHSGPAYDSEDYSGFSVLYGDVYKDYVSEDRYYKEKPFYSSHKKIKGMGICHQAIFVQGNTIRGLKFDLSYKCCSDYNMMVQIYKEGGRFLSLNMPISVYSTIGFSVQQWKLCFYEEAKICGMHSSLLYKIILCKRIAFMMMRKILNISR